eukprot:scaffold141689_cov232-Phaeocystis_antarctica.AAC.1
MIETLDTVTLDKELVNQRRNATPYQMGQQLKLHALDIHFHDHKVLRFDVGRQPKGEVKTRDLPRHGP